MESELGMEIWKKCSAVILAFCLMISGLQAFAHTENYTETDSGTKAVDYLMMLRIADERAVFTGETPLTKGEAAALIVKALGETDTARMMEVPAGLAGRSHADMAAYAVSRGILAGDGLAQSWDETITADSSGKDDGGGVGLRRLGGIPRRLSDGIPVLRPAISAFARRQYVTKCANDTYRVCKNALPRI